MTQSVSTVSIRPARPDDYDAILALWSESGSLAETDGRESPQAFLRQLSAFADSYLVAIQSGEVVGVVLGSHDHRKGWINRLAVSPRHRRKGIASALVAACEAALQRCGVDLIVAHVETHNEPSAAAFERFGYREEFPVRYFRKRLRRDR